LPVIAGDDEVCVSLQIPPRFFLNLVLTRALERARVAVTRLLP
jgi:hypothetical protein